MADKLKLNCWVLGDDEKDIFTVVIPSTESVGIMKEVISEKRQQFQAIDASSLGVRKASSRMRIISLS
jgi:hypothetical protein